MLLKGLNHVAVITNDATRLNDFYRDVFDAEVLRDGPEPLRERPGPPALHHQDRRLGRAQRLRDRGEHRGRPPDPDVRPRPPRPPGPPGGFARGLRGDPRRGSWPAARRTTSSPTSGPCSASSSGTPTASSARCCVENPDAVPGVFHGPGNPGGALLLSDRGRTDVDDVEAIKQLKARYFRTMDTKDWAGMRRVFTDDVVDGHDGLGRWRRHRRGRVRRVPAGDARRCRHRAPRPHARDHPHLVRPPRPASGRCTTSIVWPDGTRMQGDGHYHETYELVDGEWRISVLDADPPAHGADRPRLLSGDGRRGRP